MDALAKYIESKWIEDMSWDNYGPGYKLDSNSIPILDKDGKVIELRQWSVDHIHCIDDFDLLNKSDFNMVNHYTNLLPMWTKDNSSKGNKTELSPKFHKHLLEKYKDLNILIKEDIS